MYCKRIIIPMFIYSCTYFCVFYVFKYILLRIDFFHLLIYLLLYNCMTLCFLIPFTLSLFQTVPPSGPPQEIWSLDTSRFSATTSSSVAFPSRSHKRWWATPDTNHLRPPLSHSVVDAVAFWWSSIVYSQTVVIPCVWMRHLRSFAGINSAPKG